ncbi:response regulator [Gelidibacter gilvus]|uniref:Response regulator n=1 Tax=Gelidibacter gilvus TaxID=59602 RepID=A0A4Q0XDL3_9FLAO|nr:response regulator [Gelidibacter gilvus]RXJ44420.1 response regulator [Gelidibacter gilvus]
MDTTYFMIIDDDADDRFFFKEGLTKILGSIACIEAEGCEEGIEILRTAVQLPHYIFLDINMPRLDGRDCLKQLKKDASLKHIPVIMYSTYFSKETIKEFRTLGASSYLNKPTDISKLSAQILEVVKDL